MTKQDTTFNVITDSIIIVVSGVENLHWSSCVALFTLVTHTQDGYFVLFVIHANYPLNLGLKFSSLVPKAFEKI